MCVMSSVMTPRISAINSLQPVCVVVSFLVVSLSPFLSLSLYAFRWTGIYSEGVSVAYHSIYWIVLLCQRAATWMESQVAAAEMFVDRENFQTRED